MIKKVVEAAIFMAIGAALFAANPRVGQGGSVYLFSCTAGVHRLVDASHQALNGSECFGAGLPRHTEGLSARLQASSLHLGIEGEDEPFCCALTATSHACRLWCFEACSPKTASWS